MWRARKWRKLLNLIDHIPRASHYIQALSLDPEYAEAIAKIQKESGDDAGPPMSTYTAEAEGLAAIADHIRQTNILLMQANSKKGTKVPEFKPYPRPKTALEQAQQRHRRERHEALSARLLRRSAPSD